MARSLEVIREEYNRNYEEICKVIEQMGGDSWIAYHKRHKTALYKKLKHLQEREHYLDALENRIRFHTPYHHEKNELEINAM
ncbi:MAG: hypothetical protein Kow00108_18180 [Calditrichia bacterium]